MGLDLMTAQDVVPPQVPAVEIPFINVQSAPPSSRASFPHRRSNHLPERVFN